MRTRTLLIVEDCPDQLKCYVEYASQLGFKVISARDEKAAKDILANKCVDVLLSDIHLSPSVAIDSFEGLEVIRFAAEQSPETIIIAMSNDPKVSTYHKTLEIGAMAYIKKPILNKDEISIALEMAYERLSSGQLREKLAKMMSSPGLSAKCEDGIVLDPVKRKLAAKLATAKQIPIVISGETGTGKEEYVKLIHKKREKLEGKPVPFVSINCATLDSSIAMATLFGHTKGAFTGADKTTKGAVGEADGGIFFLDEIHLLPIDCQKKMLRVLNDGSYERLGDPKTLKSEFQVITASSQDLDALVQKGSFLLDLRMRITGAEVAMDPLRKRLDDMHELVSLFLVKLDAKIEEGELERLVERCKQFYWQGNIRQLFKAIQTLVTMSSLYEEPIKVENLPVSPLMFEKTEGGVLSAGDSPDTVRKIMDSLLKDIDFNQAVSFYEQQILESAFKRHRTIRDVSTALNIPRSTLDMKRQKLGIKE